MNANDIVNRMTKRILLAAKLTSEEKALAKELAKAIEEYDARTTKWIKDETDPEEKKDSEKLYKADIKKLRSILEHFNAGNFEKAFDVADNLDTAVRDEIPVKVYNYMADKVSAS
jgi:uncharacterized protein YprB with RNaseH-like and TPR domain